MEKMSRSLRLFSIRSLAGGNDVFIDRAGEVPNLVRPVDEQLTHEEVVRAIRKARKPEVVLKMFREEPVSPVG